MQCFFWRYQQLRTKKVLIVHFPGLRVVRKGIEQRLHRRGTICSCILCLWYSGAYELSIFVWFRHYTATYLKYYKDQVQMSEWWDTANTYSSTRRRLERARTSSITYSLRLSRSSTILISIGVVASPNSQSSLCPPDACPPGVVHSLPFSPQREPTAGRGGIAGFARSP